MSRYLCHLRADLKYKYSKETVFPHRKRKTRQECYYCAAYQKISICVINHQRRIAQVRIFTPGAQMKNVARGSMERAKRKGKVSMDQVKVKVKVKDTAMVMVNMGKKDVSNKKEKSETKFKA